VNFEKVNPKIPIDKWNLQFPLTNTPWPTPGLRRISVNSFGVGGTNGHAVLDDAYNYLKSRNLTGSHNTNPHTPTVEQIKDIVAKKNRAIAPGAEKGTFENGHSNGTSNLTALNGNHDTAGITNGNGLHNGNVVHKNNDSASHFPRLFLFTSFDENGVKRNATTYAEYLKNVQPSQEDDYLRDLAYTLCKKRSVFPWRSYAVCSSLPELTESLSSEQGMPSAVRVGTPPKIGFVFTGQGAQWYAMGRELLIYPIFKKSIEDAATYMKSLGAEWSLLEELYRNKDETRVNGSHLAHPSCAAIQIALVDLLASWNIRPARVVGHSSGEIAAAYCAGKLSKEAAWKVAYFRGYVSAKQLGAKGAMMAVALSEADLQPYLKKVNEKHEGEVCAMKSLTLTSDIS
jgi:acyl transferase domain-containing protein